MLTYDSKARPSAIEILKNPWFSKVLPKKILSKEVMENIREFTKLDKLHQIVMWFISSNTSNLKQEKEVIQTFHILDSNEDCKISKEELYEGLKEIFGKKIADDECVLYI